MWLNPITRSLKKYSLQFIVQFDHTNTKPKTIKNVGDKTARQAVC